MKSLFLEPFIRAVTAHPESFDLIGDCLLVESIPAEEVKTKSGLYLSGGDAKRIDGLELNKPTFARVIAVGKGYYDDEAGKDVPLDTLPGDVILVGPMGVKWLSVFGPLVSKGDHQIGISRESEIQLRFRGEAGYQAFCQTLLENVPQVP